MLPMRENDKIFGDVVKQKSISKSFPTKIKICAILKEAVSKIKIPKDFDKLDIVIISKENRFSVNYAN